MSDQARGEYDEFVNGLSADLKRLGEFYVNGLNQEQVDASTGLANNLIKTLRTRNEGGANNYILCLAIVNTACSVLDAQTGNTPTIEEHKVNENG